MIPFVVATPPTPALLLRSPRSRKTRAELREIVPSREEGPFGRRSVKVPRRATIRKIPEAKSRARSDSKRVLEKYRQWRLIVLEPSPRTWTRRTRFPAVNVPIHRRVFARVFTTLTWRSSPETTRSPQLTPGRSLTRLGLPGFAFSAPRPTPPSRPPASPFQLFAREFLNRNQQRGNEPRISCIARLFDETGS